ncbi:transposase [Viridibacillus sp. YIM B01967]|uniref:Transposase n=1 Tax=Viridibacillus soli TaxID=2798301 RepID=A0ABS1H2R2_9BACL|nr:transposase [Viridibacillus soli]MBK3493704.1 transposase [Viridibacillus soli]
MQAVASDFARRIQTVFPSAIHVLDRFHMVQFFTDALQRRLRYLGEAKKHHKSRFIDRCLARCPPDLTEEERGFVAQWHQEDDHTKHIYQALQHIRDVFKATTMTQAKRRLKEWFRQY